MKLNRRASQAMMGRQLRWLGTSLWLAKLFSPAILRRFRMCKRIQFGLLVLVCVVAGRLAGQTTIARAWAEPAGNTSSTASASKYDLRSIYIGDTWETWRFDRNSGESWHEADNKLIKVKDSKPVPHGDYDIQLITNSKMYLAHRIDRKSGRVWRINGTEWMELLPQN
jgi:hypothetical protein